MKIFQCLGRSWREKSLILLANLEVPKNDRLERKNTAEAGRRRQGRFLQVQVWSGISFMQCLQILLAAAMLDVS